MNLGQHILLFGVRVYRLVISPAKLFVFGSLSRCRFTPSCSQYALQAISRHGACRGTWLALKRICRCHPWGGCGEDPVPPIRPTPASQPQLGRTEPSAPLDHTHLSSRHTLARCRH